MEACFICEHIVLGRQSNLLWAPDMSVQPVKFEELRLCCGEVRQIAARYLLGAS